MVIKDFKVPIANCPNCGKKVDAAMSVNGKRKPRWGDVSICIECHHISVYDNGLQLRNPTDDEMLSIAGNPDVIKAMKALEAFDHERQQRAKSTETKPS